MSNDAMTKECPNPNAQGGGGRGEGCNRKERSARGGGGKSGLVRGFGREGCWPFFLLRRWVAWCCTGSVTWPAADVGAEGALVRMDEASGMAPPFPIVRRHDVGSGGLYRTYTELVKQKIGECVPGRLSLGEPADLISPPRHQGHEGAP